MTDDFTPTDEQVVQLRLFSIVSGRTAKQVGLLPKECRRLVALGFLSETQDHLTLRELYFDLLNTLMEATQLAEEGWSRVPSDARAALACEQIEGLKAIFQNSLAAAATIDWPADTRLADSVTL